MHPLHAAIAAEDLPAVAAALAAQPDLLNDRRRPAILGAQSVVMAEHLLALGADPKLASEGWASGIGTDRMSAEVAELLVARGAELTPHAAAGLGLVDQLHAMLRANPQVVHARGGDGCTPLHFARTVAVAALLLEHGAVINARDDDHDSTPAQWRIGAAPEVTRFLLDRGAVPDIFLAAALGDRALVERLLRASPGCLAFRIGRSPDFPPIGYRGAGGTILQWTLAFNSYPHQVALLKGHNDLFDFMYAESDATTKLLVSCVLARRAEAAALAAANPGIVESLAPAEKELVAKYCWETNTNYDAVKLMLDVGFPVSHPEPAHGYTPLHNAAWSASVELVELLLARGHPVDIVDPRYHATPLGFALHDALVEKRHPEGDFARTVRLLVDAGSPLSGVEYPTGDAAIDAVLAPHF